MSLVLAQNKHYWRVSDIANQKALDSRHLGVRESNHSGHSMHVNWGEICQKMNTGIKKRKLCSVQRVTGCLSGSWLGRG
jgi:hypothetical protein